MPSDSDPIIVCTGCPDDFTAVFTDILSKIQWKLFGIILFVFIMLSSDVFINRVLVKFDGAVDHKYPTSYGTVLQGLFLVIACIFIDVAVRQKII